MKIDLHVHTQEVSYCGHVPAAEMVRLYREAGYDGIVITNHFCRDTADRRAAEGHPDFAKFYQESFRLAESEGAKLGLRVFCGFEVRFDGGNNDYLTYGMPEDLQFDYDRIFRMKAGDFCALARERGFLVYQAHPFRNHMRILPPESLYGIEVRNGHPRHDSRNEIAAMWAAKYHLRGIAGSDAHQVEDVGTAGVETPRDVRTLNDLIAMLSAGDYTIF